MSSRNARIAILSIHVLCAFVLMAPGYVRPDSIALFSYLRSAVFDGDFAFFNEWASAGLVRDGVTLFSEVTPTGALANHWWIGTSILSAPPYVVTALVAARGDGFSGLYAVVLAWTNVALSAATMMMAWSLVRRFAPELGPKHAALALAATAAGTPYLWQAMRTPLGSHISGAFTIGLVLTALFRRQEGHNDAMAGAAVGIAAGLAIATRLQHFVILPAIVYVALGQRRSLRYWLSAAAAGALPLAIQAASWTAIYGTPLGPLTSGANLTGTTWMPFQNIALLTVLTSGYHGLFTWSPVVLLAILGWLFNALSPDARQRTLSACCLLMFCGEWIANGTFDRYFWGGMAFGARRFVDLAVPFAVGLAWLIRALSTRVATAVIVVAATWSALLMIAALAQTLSLSRYVTVPDLFNAVFSPETWRRALEAPLHSAIGSSELLLQSLAALGIVGALGIVAAILVRAPRHVVIVGVPLLAVALGVTIVCAARTPARSTEWSARLGIDTAASRRLGPLLDERKLLLDEVAWSRGSGRVERAERTTGEIAAIDAAIRDIEARRHR